MFFFTKEMADILLRNEAKRNSFLNKNPKQSEEN